MEQNRIRSKVVWAAALAQVIIVLQITGVLEISQIEIINGVVTAVLQLLVLFGVLNNPTKNDGF